MRDFGVFQELRNAKPEKLAIHELVIRLNVPEKPGRDLQAWQD